MEELQREVAQLKIEIKFFLDELGHIVVNNISVNEDTETSIRKSQNTLKILDKLCQV